MIYLAPPLVQDFPLVSNFWFSAVMRPFEGKVSLESHELSIKEPKPWIILSSDNERSNVNRV